MEVASLNTGSLTDYFDCTYVINLAERADRRKEVTGELVRAGMPLRAGRVEIFRGVKPEAPRGFPGIGARGCFLSHLSVLKDALQRGLSNVLIVEDDLMLLPAVNRSIDQLITGIRSVDWGIIHLGHLEKAPDSGSTEFVRFHGPVVTAFFYAVNGPVIPRLIDYLEQVQCREPGDPLGGPMHFDGALTMFREANPDVATFLACPGLGRQRRSRSNVNSPWYEGLPLIRQAADFLRVVRGYLGAGAGL